MPRITSILGALFLLCVSGGGRLWAGVCRAPDATSQRIQTRLALYAMSTAGDNKTVRDSLHLPSTSQVSAVTSEAVCKKANAAYQAALAGTGHGFSGQVYVIQVGTSYAVYDPVYHWGPDAGFYTVVIFDSRWRQLSFFNP